MRFALLLEFAHHAILSFSAEAALTISLPRSLINLSDVWQRARARSQVYSRMIGSPPMRYSFITSSMSLSRRSRRLRCRSAAAIAGPVGASAEKSIVGKCVGKSAFLNQIGRQKSRHLRNVKQAGNHCGTGIFTSCRRRARQPLAQRHWRARPGTGSFERHPRPWAKPRDRLSASPCGWPAYRGSTARPR
jgi:hypothetical protein